MADAVQQRRPAETTAIALTMSTGKPATCGVRASRRSSAAVATRSSSVSSQPAGTRKQPSSHLGDLPVGYGCADALIARWRTSPLPRRRHQEGSRLLSEDSQRVSRDADGNQADNEDKIETGGQLRAVVFVTWFRPIAIAWASAKGKTLRRKIIKCRIPEAC